MSRRSRTSKRMVDKWSTKKVYVIISPKGFLDMDERVIGETIADEPEKVIGRVIEVPLSSLVDDYSKAHIKILFQITEIVGDTAKTRFKGHVFARDYLRFLVRRRRTRIDSITTVTTKDNVPLRVTATGFTKSRSKTSQKDAIRRRMLEILNNYAKEHTLYEFIKDAVLCDDDYLIIRAKLEDFLLKTYGRILNES